MTMSRRFQGIGVSPGVAYAPAMVVDLRFPDVVDRSITAEEVETEVARLQAAVGQVVASLTTLQRRVEERAGPEEAGIFEAQVLMAGDPDFLGAIEHLIRTNLLSAETAFEFKALEVRVAWSGASSGRLRERLADLTAVQLRMLRVLTGGDAVEFPSRALDEAVVLVAHELSPGLTVQFDRQYLAALVSEEGTRTSHAAILAHSLGIPAVMGVGGGIIGRLESGTVLLVDGQSGAIVIDPSPAELREASTQVNRRRKFELELEAEVDLPCITPDGRGVAMLANVDLPEEIDIAVRHGAQGVGLLRTEFLMTGRSHLPTEEEQARYFRRVATAFPKGTVTIRTFDLGGDKFPVAFDAPEEANPFLGWRSIRVCLDQPHIFRPQLRALLRASVTGNIRVMLPLVTRVDEVLRTREIVAEEAAALAAAGIPAAAELVLGVMIETPAAVVLADRLARVSDFFSVGTNDLTQYTLAVDRGNARLASRFTPHDPSLLCQLRQVVQAADDAGIPVGVCGEMASEPLMAILLLGMGYDALSVAPPTLLLVKWLLRQVPYAVAQEVALRALQADGPDEVLVLLRESVRSFVDPRILDTHGPLPGKGP
jgi:phosphotransferase system enzyme I (PtsI)